MFNSLRQKIRQIVSFFKYSKTPLALSLDSLRIKRSGYQAISKNGLKLNLRANSGEGFTFYENIIRRDYLQGGITLAAGNTVVDIGANIGSFTILAGSIVGQAGRVLAYEPMPETYKRLQENAELNRLENTKCFNAAVDAYEGTLAIKLSKKSALASAHVVNSAVLNEESVTVPCLTLRQIFEANNLERINLLKVDCEGSEYGIFETLSPDLAQRIDQIAMEVHAVPNKSYDKLKESLENLGFEVHCLYPWVAFNVSHRVTSELASTL